MEKQLGLEEPISEYLGYCDFELCKKSNIAIYGLSGCGKTRLANDIASQLSKQNYFIAYFDVVGNIRDISDLRHYQKIDREKPNIVLPTEEGIIYDISDLLLNDQQAFVNNFLEIFWLCRKVNIEWKKQAIIILEESELYCQYLNSKTTPQILKFCMAGRNEPIRTRVMAISPRIANVSTSISEMCEQVYLGTTLGDRNAVKIRHLFGKEYVDVAKNLDVGQFLWKHSTEIDIVKVPLFQPKSKPQEIRPPTFWDRLLNPNWKVFK